MNRMPKFRFAPHFPHIDEQQLLGVMADSYTGVEFFGRSFLEIYEASLNFTNAGISPYQAMNKLRRCYNLCLFYIRSRDAEGDIAEAGVFRGSTARLIVELIETGKLDIQGREFLLFDSFEGLPDLASSDVPSIEAAQGTGPDPFHKVTPRRFSNTSEEEVRAVFRDYPWVSTQKGWIPEVFAGFEPRRFSFVHIDVDLYRSTRDCLDFFVPRMSPGGIILCDDYLSVRFPGARLAWDEYCEKHGVRFVTLDNYQAAMIAE